MRTLAVLLLFALTCHAGDRSSDGMVSVAKFSLSPPASGLYGPWRDKDKNRPYAGELIVITNASFRYTTFSDVVGKRPEYSGTVSVFKDHIYLNHPGIPYPYRVAGVADGVPVLFTWEGFEQWKKTGKVFELNVLYLQKPTKRKK
ncbi:MAG TPA: hypothetical protein VFB72_10950 [Verrucomicrobiae bacterium]|nr:hypothetical protein [Verrucomicrobiae bacterium]